MKKGCVLKNSESSDKVDSLNVSWYYTWNNKKIPNVKVPFVPMVWGKNSVIPYSSDIILVLNEPDRPDQSNITVIEALNIWNSVNATKKGSPATAANALKSPWFIEFMNSAKPDFICIHWYGPPNVNSLLKLVDGLHEKYGLPIWITEFAVAQWDTTKPMYTLQEVKAFMRNIIPELESRKYVERYAWKTRDPSDPYMGTSALFDSNGQLTELGKLYSEI